MLNQHNFHLFLVEEKKVKYVIFPGCSKVPHTALVDIMIKVG